MADEFDDDMLQEGLGNGLRGRVPQHAIPRGLADDLVPATGQPGYIDLYYYKGVKGNPAGHLGASVNGGLVYGAEPIPGDERVSLFKTVRGYLQPVDRNRPPLDHLRIPASADQARQVKQYMLDPANSRTYNAEAKNCVTLPDAALRAAGLPAPADASWTRPSRFMKELREMYYPTTHQLVNTWPTLPKY